MWVISPRQAAAAKAIATVVHESVLYMRAMAYHRETMCDEVFPETDYSEQICLLADTCDNLVTGLRPGGRRPLDALQFTWDNRSEAQQNWIRHCVESLTRMRVEDLLNTDPDRERVMSNTSRRRRWLCR